MKKKWWDVDDIVYFGMTVGFGVILPITAIVCFTLYKIAALFA